MTERASIFEAVQVGVETTPGEAVPALKRLLGLTVTPGIKASINTYRGTGIKFPTVSSMGKEWVEMGLGGPLTYTDIVYLLSGYMRATTPVQDPTGVYTWTFTPAIYGPDTVKTFTIEQGSVFRAHRFTYGLITGGTIAINRDECTFQGSMIAHSIEDNIRLSTNASYSVVGSGVVTGGTFTLTVTSVESGDIDFDATAGEVQTALEAISTVGVGNVVCTGGPLPSTAVVVTFINDLAQTSVTMTADDTNILGGGNVTSTATASGAAPTTIGLVPVSSPQVLVYLATTQAGLATASPLARNFSVSVGLTNRFGPVWVLNGTREYAAHVELAPELSMSLLVEADDEGMAQLPRMQAGSTVWLRVQATSPTMITGTSPYTMTIDAAGKITEPSAFSDEGGVYAIEWAMTGVADPTWGKALQIVVQNGIASL